MENTLQNAFFKFKQTILSAANLTITQETFDAEGKEYSAGSFTINHSTVIFRRAKITPTKTGFFVTLWKRDESNITTPYDSSDLFKVVVIECETDMHRGYFLFPKDTLVRQKIISIDNKGGKRGFRVYAPWNKHLNATAKKTQSWQLRYFFDCDALHNIQREKLKIFD